ncbi:MAG: alpha/beta hydrolase family protein, partial [Longimicrobiales bacterium]
MKRTVGALLFALVITPPAPSIAQELITAADLSDLNAPPADARISYGEDPLQFGKLRLPDGPGPYPTLVFIHGGCWLSAFDITHAGQAEEALAEAGYAVWS